MTGSPFHLRKAARGRRFDDRAGRVRDYPADDDKEPLTAHFVDVVRCSGRNGSREIGAEVRGPVEWLFQGGQAGSGNLAVFVRLRARYADCSNRNAVLDDDEAAFERNDAAQGE